MICKISAKWAYAVGIFAWATIGFVIVSPMVVKSQAAESAAGQSSNAITPVRSIVVFVNRSQLVSFTTPFNAVQIASTEIADVTPLTERSLYIQGKKIGTTVISVFDQNKQLVERLDLEITNDTKNLHPPEHLIVVAINKSQTVSFTKPFITAVVASTEIADIAPLTDRSLYIQGKKIGTTDISVFDQNMQLVEILGLEVTNNTKNLHPPGRLIVVAINESQTVSFTKPYTMAVVASTAIADMEAPTDHSLYVVGKKSGTTDISVFDQNKQLVEHLDLEVTGPESSDYSLEWAKVQQYSVLHVYRSTDHEEIEKTDSEAACKARLVATRAETDKLRVQDAKDAKTIASLAFPLTYCTPDTPTKTWSMDYDSGKPLLVSPYVPKCWFTVSSGDSKKGKDCRDTAEDKERAPRLAWVLVTGWKTKTRVDIIRHRHDRKNECNQWASKALSGGAVFATCEWAEWSKADEEADQK